MSPISDDKNIDLPGDLYIPPNALRVFLDTFNGPLDLLLYLIRKQNIDILDIPIAKITEQYMEYIKPLSDFAYISANQSSGNVGVEPMQLDLAAEYLVMAATLAAIKSHMLLPRHPSLDAEETDPRAELVRRLHEYELYKQAAEMLDTLPRVDRDVLPIVLEMPSLVGTETPVIPDVTLHAITCAMQELLKRSSFGVDYQVQLEVCTIAERMEAILVKLQSGRLITFNELFKVNESRVGIITNFIAMLELLKQAVIEVIQNRSFDTIYLQIISKGKA